ncbi:MAG TPA: hypothetical protein VLE02_05145 [Nitrosarchaeum sp.]|nr:hypothetical protein [Nitrosarchaeum sp.]
MPKSELLDNSPVVSKMIDVSDNEHLGIDIFTEQCFDIETNTKLEHHSILVGKRTLTCMNCGKIILEYKNRSDFDELMRFFEKGTTKLIKGDAK